MTKGMEQASVYHGDVQAAWVCGAPARVPGRRRSDSGSTASAVLPGTLLTPLSASVTSSVKGDNVWMRSV